MKRIPLVLLFLGTLIPLFSEVEFSDLSLGATNKVVFKATAPSPEAGTISGHFLGEPGKKSLEALTFMPESLLYLPKTGQIQIQNRFGVFRSAPDLKTMTQVNLESFVSGKSVPEGKLLPQAVSSDGRFLMYQKPKSLVRGDLILFEPSTGNTLTISENIPLNYREVPILWSPDSRFFIYAKAGGVYYFSIKQLDESRVPTENYRLLGKGTKSSASWGEDGSLYLVLEEFIYRILPEQFFTHSLYGGLFRTGTIVGKLPYLFDPDKDQFWMSPEKSWVLLNLRGRNLFLYPLETQDFYPSTQPIIFKPLPTGLEIMRVLWTGKGQATLLSRSLYQGGEKYEVFRITSSGIQTLLGPQDQPIMNILLSPSGSELALVTGSGVSLRSPASLKELRTIPQEGARFAVYAGEQNLIISGTSYTARYTSEAPQGSILFFSTLDQVGYTPEGKLGAQAGGKSYLWSGQGRWLSVDTMALAPGVTTSTAFRVYLESQVLGPYRNMIMLRNLKAGGTENLLVYPERNYDPFPSLEEPSAKDLFSHGSRLRKREVTLSIDASTSAEGLPEVLRALKDYNFRSTFFINGEFMRRQPNATVELSKSGQEMASGFSLWFDMSDPRFKMDPEFIKSGLSRNEDDYFNLTGKEMTLYWHSPNYYLDDSVIRGGQNASYTYVSRDVEFIRSRTDEVDVIDAIETILREKKPGSIIPLTLGMKDARTGEGFFKYLDILLNALTLQGYQVVPVSSLKDNAR